MSCKDIKPEIIFVCSSNMAPYILDLPRDADAICLVDLVDVDSEKWRSLCARSAAFPMNWVYRREWRRVADLEARIVRECDWSVFVSDAEAALFRKAPAAIPEQDPGRQQWRRSRLFRSGPPLPGALSDWTSANFVFTGTMDYPPNVDAVVWFAQGYLARHPRLDARRTISHCRRQPGAAGQSAGHRSRACS